MRKLYQEFKAFAMGGDLIEIAVALVLALAFVTVIGSLVANIIMPIVGILFGEPSFSNLVLTINDSVIYYGAFLTSVVTFLVIALALFLLVVKPYQMYQARRAVEEEEVVGEMVAEDIVLLRQIRDSLQRG